MTHIIPLSAIRYILSTLLLTSLFVSCKKLIEIPQNPRTELSTNRVFSDSSNIVSAIAGVYANFGTTNRSMQFLNGGITVYTGLTGDELVPGADVYSGPAFYNNMIAADNSNVKAMWETAYKTIFDINLCLEGIANTSAISEPFKKQLTGELKVCRAFCYFNLVNIWGGVPIITVTDYNVTQNVARSSTDSVYQFVVSDLTEANALLTAEYPSSGHARPNKYVASTLLAKVYLYQGQYQNAIDAATSVLSSGLYLLSGIGNVFVSGSEEAIWQLPANGIYNSTAEASTFIPYSALYTPNYVLSPYLLSAFEAGDLRKENWTGFSTVNDGTGTVDYYYPAKYKNVYPDQSPAEDYTLLRLADVLLIRAEALARSENLTDALADLNEVRDRAGLDDFNTTLLDDAVTAILHERQVELFCEWGNRWFDLKRTNTINTVLGTEKTNWNDWAALFPIPTAELQNNSFLKPNPGY